jgi:hypothetical protein
VRLANQNCDTTQDPKTVFRGKVVPGEIEAIDAGKAAQFV